MAKVIKYRPINSKHKDKLGLDLRFGDLIVFVGFNAARPFSTPCIFLCDAGPTMSRYYWFHTMSGIIPDVIDMMQSYHNVCVPHCVRIARVNYQTRRVTWMNEEYRNIVGAKEYEEHVQTLVLPPEVVNGRIE